MARQFTHDGAQWTVREYGQGGAGFRAIGQGLEVGTLKLLFTRTDNADEVKTTAPIGFTETATDDQLRATLVAAQRAQASDE